MGGVAWHGMERKKAYDQGKKKEEENMINMLYYITLHYTTHGCAKQVRATATLLWFSHPGVASLRRSRSSGYKYTAQPLRLYLSIQGHRPSFSAIHPRSHPIRHPYPFFGLSPRDSTLAKKSRHVMAMSRYASGVCVRKCYSLRESR